MKKLFSLCMATLLAMGMFAQTKTVITAEKLWNYPIAKMTAVAEARQGSGYNGTVYVADKASHSVLAYAKVGDEVKQDTVVTNPAICSTGIAVDDAGNIILAAAETTDAWYATPTKLLVVNKEAKTVEALAITALGRTDYIFATGNIKSAEGGYVYLYGNAAKAIAVHFVSGAIESTATIEASATAGTGGQVVYVGTPTSCIAQVRASALQFIGREAVTLPDIFNSKLGLDVFTIAGKQVYAYNIGTAYNSLFQLYNATDEALIPDMEGNTQLFAVDATKAQSTSCANWLRATVIDENNVYIQQYCGSDGAALWKVSAVVAAEVAVSCDENQGTVTGGGDIAVGANATVVATPKPGFEFVAWKKGDETVSTDASYTFAVTESVALTAIFEAKENVTITLAVNDAQLGSITLPEGIVMGENSVAYGTELILTAVPVEGASFAGWFKGEELYSSLLEIKLICKESISLKANFTKVLKLTYELNGGITNPGGWVSKPHMALDLQKDYNAEYNTSKAWAKDESGVIYYYVSGEWQLPEKVQGKAADIAGFIQNVTWNANSNMVNLLHKDKWLVLANYIDTLRVRAGNAVADDAAMRTDVSGFFLCSPAITDYRTTNDYALAGAPEAFLGACKIAFANPEEIVNEFTLNAPYKEDFTFDGWYAEADFSGEKITKVSPESKIEGGKLYAKWIEYIPTLAEITAMEENTVTKAKGVVTYVNGKNAYIQDATAGMLLYAPQNFTFQVGQQVIVKGTRTVYGGAPELKNVEEVSAEAGTMPNPIALATLATVKEDPLKYFGLRVLFKGLTIVALDSYKNPSVSDGVDTVLCYKMSVDDTKFPVGTVVNVTAIAGYFNGFQLVGDVAGIVEAGGAGKDPYAYPAYGDNNEYTLTNKWIFSNIQDNFASNMPAPLDHARGMVAKDGKMYFINRQNGSFTVVNGANGKKLDPIQITGEHLFETEVVTDSATMAKEWKSCATLPFNDVKLDQAGHFLIAGCVTTTQRFQVYKVDITTGAATNVVDDRLYDYDDYKAESWRFDAFNVYGDVDNHAIIMAVDANSFWVYYWEIENGKAGEAQRIDCTPDPVNGDRSLLIKEDGTLSETSFGTAPQVFPVDFEYFYVDGWSTLPMLYDMDGSLVQDFIDVPTGVKVPMANDTCTLKTGHNGLCEFQIGSEYYLVMAATNVEGKPASAFAIYKYADEDREFTEMTPLWFFPHEGMGTATVGSRVAVPSVEVIDDKAYIYVYTLNNGYGVYEMTGVLGGDAVENIGQDAAIKAEKRIENGNLYIIRNGVRYSAQGVVAQ